MADPFQSQTPIRPDYIIDVLIRGRWFLIIPLCFSLTIGLGLTFTATKLYRASTLILVQPQRVPRSYVKSVVSTSINERISTISQQILSRSNLEQIMAQFGLYENNSKMYTEEKLRALKRRIRVRMQRARHGAESFSISFTGKDPQMVMRVANTLASYFMDENLKVREAQAIGTSEFLESELDNIRRSLQEKEQKLSTYRARYLGELPGDLDTNLRTLDRLQGQLHHKTSLLREANNSITLIETQISQLKNNSENDSNNQQAPGSAQDKKLLKATQANYEKLLLKYTDKHPDVKKLKKTIEKLKQKVLADKGLETETITLNPVVSSLVAQRDNLETEVTIFQKQIANIQKRMERYQQRIDETPNRELDLNNLKRDYKNIQKIYNSLLNRLLEAELSVNMEKKQKGEQFRILDYARLPEKPITPNVKKNFMLSLITGLGLGAVVILLKEFLNFSVIRLNDQIETDLGLPILASIPQLEKPGDKMKQRIEWIMFTCCCCYIAIFLAFFAILKNKGLDRTINLIKPTIDFIKTTLNL